MNKNQEKKAPPPKASKQTNKKRNTHTHTQTNKQTKKQQKNLYKWKTHSLTQGETKPRLPSCVATESYVM